MTNQADLFDWRVPLDVAVVEARNILSRVIETHQPVAVYALFSGGHDSLCATHLASQHPRFCGAVHINTGIGIEETREFVRATCRRQGWPLREMSPPPFVPALEKRKPGIDYENLPAYDALVLHHGFPGFGGHTVMYNRLKERCLRILMRETKKAKHDRIVLVTGVRRQESRRRMGHIVAEQVDGCRVWCAPLVDWDDDHKRDYIARVGLKRSPIALALCMSGECLCGAFAKPEEMAEIAHASPCTAARIRDLEARAAKFHPPPRSRWGWGKDAKHRTVKGQQSLPLCFSCEARSEQANGHLREFG